MSISGIFLRILSKEAPTEPSLPVFPNGECTETVESARRARSVVCLKLTGIYPFYKPLDTHCPVVRQDTLYLGSKLW